MTWHQEMEAAARQAREAAVEAGRASVEAAERRLRAQRRLDEQWAVPRWGDDPTTLEALAHSMWRRAYPARPWPAGWRVRWANVLDATPPRPSGGDCAVLPPDARDPG